MSTARRRREQDARAHQSLQLLLLGRDDFLQCVLE
jgi:hypothetical protein